MNTDKTNYDNEKLNNDSQVNSTVEEQANNKVESDNTAKKPNTPTWVKVGTGMGMGLLLGSTASFVANKAFAKDDVGVDSEEGTSTTSAAEATYQEEHPWADTEIHVASNVNDNMSFSDAFATARAEVGPGGAFEWRGNVYGTYLAEEWDDLTPEQKAEYNGHFNWGNYSKTETADTASTEDVEVVDAPDKNTEATVSTEDVEVVDTPDKNAEATASTEDVEVVGDPDVEILGVVHDEELGINWGAATVDNQEYIFIDVDGDEIVDYVASDLNQDGELTDNEILDVSNDRLPISELAVDTNTDEDNSEDDSDEFYMV